MQSIGTSISVPFFGSQGGSGGGLGYAAYNYLATPTFTTRHGYGNKANNRVDLRPTGRRIIIDGTTSIVGNYYHVLDFAAAQAAYNAPGDWILLPGGTTGTVAWGRLYGNGKQFSGSSPTNMFVMGTFDPAHNTNSTADEAFYNTLKYTFDLSTATPSVDAMYTYTMNAGQGNLAFVNLVFKNVAANASTPSASISLIINPTDIAYNWLFENCTFDGFLLAFNSNLLSTTPFTSQTDAGCLNDVTVRYCGFMYGGSLYGERNGNVYVSGARRFRAEACITYHGGWGRGMTRATPPWNPGISRPITSITSVTTTATVTIASTAGFVNGYLINIGGVTPAAYNGDYNITVLNGTQFSYTFAGGVGAATVPGNYINYQENGWTKAVGAGPDAYKHGFYVTEFTDDTGFYDCVSSADSSNLKFTGGNFWVQNLVSIHEPIGWLSSAFGNNLAMWPNGSTFKSQNHLQVGSDAGNTYSALNYGWAPELYACITGSYYSTALILNNDAANTSNSTGFLGGAAGSTIPTRITFDSNVIYSWPGQTNTPNPDANTILTYTNNVWPIATSGSNTIVTGMPALYQTRIAAAAALNTHTTLRTAFSNWFSGVAVGGSNAATEVNMFEFMCNNPIPGAIFADPNVTSWATLFQYHFRSKMAGVT